MKTVTNTPARSQFGDWQSRFFRAAFFFIYVGLMPREMVQYAPVAFAMAAMGLDKVYYYFFKWIKFDELW